MTGEPITPDLEKIKLAISVPRIQPYLLQTKGNLKEAIALYQINIQLCQSLYHILHVYEVTYRNKLNESLSKEFGSEWFNDENLIREDERNNIKKARLKKLIEDENKWKLKYYIVIPDLTLGFWTSLLKKNQYSTIFNKCVKEVFSHTKENSDRSNDSIRPKLQEINNLRNEVFHHEPVFKQKYKIYEKYETVILLLEWMCPETCGWVKSSDNFLETYNKCKELIFIP